MERQNSSNTITNGGKVKLLVSYGGKVKLLVSYGGKILSRPTDRHLSYAGGDTKILAVDRHVRFSEITAKLNSLAGRREGSEIYVKYQFPGEDLDALVSLIDDEDLEHMMVEYDRMQRISAKPARLRLFIFKIHSLKPVPQMKSDPGTPSNPDYLFGFDKEYQPNNGPPLDLLQIPGVALPENHGFTENVNDSTANGGSAAAQVVYRMPALANGGVYQTGQYPYGFMPAIGNGHWEWEHPVYIVPILPPGAEQRK